jgi:hypothetical protein
MFVSHETYTPARGGSAAAEINALRAVFRCRMRTRSSSPTPRASPATPWVPASRTSSRSRPWRPASCRRCRTTRSPTPTSATSTCRGRELPGAVRAAPRGRLRLADRDVADCAGPDARRPAARTRRSSATPTGSSTKPPGSAGSTPPLRHPAAARSRLTTGGLRIVDRGAPKTPVALTTHVPRPVCRGPRARRCRLRPAAGTANASATTPFASLTPVAVPPSPVAHRPAAGVHRHFARPRSPGRRHRCGHLPSPPPAAPRPLRPSQLAPAGDPILDQVTKIVAEMTGYPADLLDPDLDLEADLGVDTVKQAEVFRRRPRALPGRARRHDLKLRDFPTLRHVAGWVRGKPGWPEPGGRTGGPRTRGVAARAPASPAPAVAQLRCARPTTRSPGHGIVAR